MKTKKLTFLSLLIASTIAGRLFFATIPNVQPVTAVIIFTTIYFSVLDATLVNISVIFISNLYLGFGIWTLYQILSYTVIIMLVQILKNFKLFKNNLIVQSVFSFLSGIIYGFVISILSATMFSKISNFWTYFLAGISFDLMHSIGNLIIYTILTPILLKIKLNYFKKPIQ